MDRCKVLSRDAIKYIAMFTMLLNHTASLFLYGDNGMDTWPAFIMTYLGYFTEPVMVFFLVEGYSYTKSRKRYLLRLLVFAVIAQIPFGLHVSHGETLFCPYLNMLFTLSICFCIVWIMDRVPNIPLRNVLVCALIFFSVCCDWWIMAPVDTLLFVWAGNSEKRRRIAFAGAAALFFAIESLVASWPLATSPGRFLLCLLWSASGIGLAAVCILFLYNGKRARRGRNFSKWFFYLFYPLHLSVLVGIKMLTGL